MEIVDLDKMMELKIRRDELIAYLKNVTKALKTDVDDLDCGAYCDSGDGQFGVPLSKEDMLLFLEKAKKLYEKQLAGTEEAIEEL